MDWVGLILPAGWPAVSLNIFRMLGRPQCRFRVPWYLNHMRPNKLVFAALAMGVGISSVIGQSQNAIKKPPIPVANRPAIPNTGAGLRVSPTPGFAGSAPFPVSGSTPTNNFGGTSTAGFGTPSANGFGTPLTNGTTTSANNFGGTSPNGFGTPLSNGFITTSPNGFGRPLTNGPSPLTNNFGGTAGTGFGALSNNGFGVVTTNGISAPTNNFFAQPIL
jgi:hypothetical protein